MSEKPERPVDPFHPSSREEEARRASDGIEGDSSELTAISAMAPRRWTRNSPFDSIRTVDVIVLPECSSKAAIRTGLEWRVPAAEGSSTKADPSDVSGHRHSPQPGQHRIHPTGEVPAVPTFDISRSAIRFSGDAASTDGE